MITSRDYLVYGLRLRSDLELPELEPIERGGEPDVTIMTGDTAREDRVPGMHPIDGGAGYRIDDVASFDIIGGSTIIVRPDLGAAERNVRLYLLGSALGMLIHQRGLLPLHATAVELDGRALVFMGHSGAGKSTLAAWFNDAGIRVIADDVSAISFDESGIPLVQPGIPRLRLWKDMLEATGRQGRFEPSYFGAENWPKYDVPIPAGGGAVPLGAPFLLDKGQDPTIEEMAGLEAARAVVANTYRGSYVGMTQHVATHWKACMAISNRLPMFRWRRSFEFANRECENNALVELARLVLAKSANGQVEGNDV